MATPVTARTRPAAAPTATAPSATTPPPTTRAGRAGPRARAAAPGQRSFDDLGTPLFDVTFCVVDLETTGGSPADCAITEIGAVKLRGGECLGTFHTLVNPGVPIPPLITVLTGITEAMVIPAPRIGEVLPSFLEFARGCVIVGHNIRFDLSFLNAALAAHGRPALAHRSVDTLALARRLMRDEVPNCQLGTLADRLRLPHRPAHRALDDALATADLLHVLLERAGSLGVTGLDDLLALPSMSGHAQAGKLKLTDRLPRSPGVYLFRDRNGAVLYVGKATNLRSRVRSYFSTDDRRKIGQLLRETASVDHRVCATTVEAAVLEVRLIHALQPRFNRQAKTWTKYRYLKLTLGEAFPRLSVVRSVKADGALYLGPLSSAGAAAAVADAIHTVVPLRRCSERLAGRRTAPLREAPCSAAQLGVAMCPCSGSVTAEEYRRAVDLVVRGLTVDPGTLLEPLAARMVALARAERFEEAADTRDRAAALSSALRRQRRIDQLVQAERLVIAVAGGTVVELRSGILTATGAIAPDPPPGVDPRPREHAGQAQAASSAPAASSASAATLPLDIAGHEPRLTPWALAAGWPDLDLHPTPPTPGAPLPLALADEVLAVAQWLDRNHARTSLVTATGTYASALPPLPTFTPA